MFYGNKEKVARALVEIRKYSHALIEPISVAGIEDKGPVLVVTHEVMEGIRNLEIFIKHALVHGSFERLDDDSIAKMSEIYDEMSVFQWDFPLYDGNQFFQVSTPYLRELISFGAFCFHSKEHSLEEIQQNIPEGMEGQSFENILDDVFKETIIENLSEMLVFYLYDGKLPEFSELYRLIGAAAQNEWLPFEEILKQYSKLLEQIAGVLEKDDAQITTEIQEHWKITQLIHAVMSKMSDGDRKAAKRKISEELGPLKKIAKKFKNRDYELVSSEITGFERSLDISAELAGSNTGMFAHIAIQGMDKFGTRINLAYQATGVFGLGTFSAIGGLAAAIATNRVGWVVPGPLIMFLAGFESICVNDSHDQATSLHHLNPYRPNAEEIRKLASNCFKTDTAKQKLSPEAIAEFLKISNRLSKLERIISDPSSVLVAHENPTLDL